MEKRSRFSAEEKINATEAYIRGEMGWNQIIYKFGIANSTLQTWIRKYYESGREGLHEKPKNKSYSTELKREAMDVYLRWWDRKTKFAGDTVFHTEYCCKIGCCSFSANDFQRIRG